MSSAPKFTPVTSSNLEGIHYDEATRTLTVKFKSGGTYAYGGVVKDHYNGIINASSPGKYLHEHIKRGGSSYVKK